MQPSSPNRNIGVYTCKGDYLTHSSSAAHFKDFIRSLKGAYITHTGDTLSAIGDPDLWLLDPTTNTSCAVDDQVHSQLDPDQEHIVFVTYELDEIPTSDGINKAMSHVRGSQPISSPAPSSGASSAIAPISSARDRGDSPFRGLSFTQLDGASFGKNETPRRQLFKNEANGTPDTVVEMDAEFASRATQALSEGISLYVRIVGVLLTFFASVPPGSKAPIKVAIFVPALQSIVYVNFFAAVRDFVKPQLQKKVPSLLLAISFLSPRSLVIECSFCLRSEGDQALYSQWRWMARCTCAVPRVAYGALYPVGDPKGPFCWSG
jgi:hypothetical protein